MLSGYYDPQYGNLGFIGDDGEVSSYVRDTTTPGAKPAQVLVYAPGAAKPAPAPTQTLIIQHDISNLLRKGCQNWTDRDKYNAATYSRHSATPYNLKQALQAEIAKCLPKAEVVPIPVPSAPVRPVTPARPVTAARSTRPLDVQDTYDFDVQQPQVYARPPVQAYTPTRVTSKTTFLTTTKKCVLDQDVVDQFNHARGYPDHDRIYAAQQAVLKEKARLKALGCTVEALKCSNMWNILSALTRTGAASTERIQRHEEALTPIGTEELSTAHEAVMQMQTSAVSKERAEAIRLRDQYDQLNREKHDLEARMRETQEHIGLKKFFSHDPKTKQYRDLDRTQQKLWNRLNEQLKDVKARLTKLTEQPSEPSKPQGLMDLFGLAVKGAAKLQDALKPKKPTPEKEVAAVVSAVEASAEVHKATLAEKASYGPKKLLEHGAEALRRLGKGLSLVGEDLAEKSEDYLGTTGVHWKLNPRLRDMGLSDLTDTEANTIYRGYKDGGEYGAALTAGYIVAGKKIGKTVRDVWDAVINAPATAYEYAKKEGFEPARLAAKKNIDEATRKKFDRYNKPTFKDVGITEFTTSENSSNEQFEEMKKANAFCSHAIREGLRQKAENALVHMKKALGIPLSPREEINLGISNALEAKYGEAVEKAVQTNKDPTRTMGERYFAAKRVAHLLGESEKDAKELSNYHAQSLITEAEEVVAYATGQSKKPPKRTVSPELFGLNAQREKIAAKLEQQQHALDVLRSRPAYGPDVDEHEAMIEAQEDEIRGHQAQLKKVNKEIQNVLAKERPSLIKEVVGLL